MNIRKGALGLLLVVAVVVSACGASTPTPEAMMENEAPTAEAMMEEEASTAETMMEKEAPTAEAMMEEEASTAETMMEEETSTDEAMMGEEASTTETMMEEETPATETMVEEETSTDEAMMGEEASTTETMMEEETSASEAMMDEEAMMTAAWFGVELTDVNTGETFKVADFKGKVVLVETLAVWCSTCLRQQKQVQALHELLGERDDFVSIGLDIDPNETADTLKAHTEKNSFGWLYAIAPVEVAREIGHLYGDQFLNPPSAPMLIVDRQGQAHPLPFGVKSAETLQEALSPYLNQ